MSTTETKAKTKPEKPREPTELQVALKKLKTRFRWNTLRFYVFLNKIKLPGFYGIGLFDVLQFFLDGLRDRNFTLQAAAMAFRFFFALFPGLIFLFTLIPYLPLRDVEIKIVAFLTQLVPGRGLELVTETVNELFHTEQVGLLSFNLVLTIFTSLAGIRAMMFAFTKHGHEAFERRNIFTVNGVAFVIFIVLLIGFFLAFGVWIYGELLIEDLAQSGMIESSLLLGLMHIGVWVIILLAFYLSISFIYYFAPETRERGSFFSPGSIVASFLSLLAVFGFRTFINNFANYNKLYGSLSAIMVLMLFFYWMSMVLLIGFELNAAIAMAKHRDRVKLTDLDDFDSKKWKRERRKKLFG